MILPPRYYRPVTAALSAQNSLLINHDFRITRTQDKMTPFPGMSAVPCSRNAD